MSSMLNPAGEFDYSPRVRELFTDLKHARPLPQVGAMHAAQDTLLSAQAGSREQGASVRLQIELQDGHIQSAHYQAYGCPHFLAACECLARWLKGRAYSELSRWNWRDVEAELAVPPAKRSRLLLLSDALAELSKSLTKVG